MSLDPKVKEAINSAVSEYEQPAKVAKRLISWMTELSNGNTTLDSADDVGRPLEEVLEAIEIEED